MDVPKLEMSHISKAFSGVNILQDVNFTLRQGEVHALVGQNGAGKSTLMKILNGVHVKDSGTISIDGKPAHYATPLEARAYGISMVFQEFSLVPSMTVAENVFLGTASYKTGIFLNDTLAEKRTRELLHEINREVAINPKALVEKLSVGSRQLVEIAKALSHNSTILVLDEPTASLSHAETESLFQTIRRLQAKGISIVYISHYLKDIFKICDTVTVLRDGRACFTSPIRATTIDAVIAAMLGEKVHAATSRQARKTIQRETTPLLEVKQLTTKTIRDISFQLWRGEILGFAGLLGSGRTEILRAIFGIDPLERGDLLINGKQVAINNTKDAFRHGIAIVPEDRRNQGLILDFSVRDNLLLPILGRLVRNCLIRDRLGTEVIQQYFTAFRIKAKNIEQPVKFLSGGNQQKVVVAKNIASQSQVLLLDDPTFGVDIHSKLEIMHIVHDFVNQGNGAIFISSEFDEIAAYCDRILIVNKGRIVQSVSKEDGTAVTEELLLKLVQ